MDVLKLPIARVTVFEDRAQIERRGPLQLAAGAHRLVLKDLSPVVVDRTVSVLARGARVTSIRLDRAWRLRQDERPEEIAALLVQRDALEDELHRLDAAARADELATKGLGETARQLLAELCVDASHGRTDAPRWSQDLSAVRSVLAVHQDRAIQGRLEHGLRSQDLRDLHRRIRALEDPGSVLRCQLEVGLALDDAGSVELEVVYMVPCAAWRPWHRATLLGDRIVWDIDAAVWQHTGESWEGVELALSTERASLGTEPPRLRTEHLQLEKSGKEIDAEIREQAIDTAGGGTRTVDKLPGIDDGGEARVLTAVDPATVPSTGQPVRIPLSSWEAPAAVDRVLRAELKAQVLVRSKQRQAGTQPILPGPVDLVRDSGLVGRTWVDFLSPDEEFELGWGPDHSLRVSREEIQKPLATRLLSQWSGNVFERTIKLSNLGSEQAEVHIEERVPVSELDAVQIEVEGGDADRDGVVRWSVRVPGGGRHRQQWSVQVRKKSKVQGL